MNTTITVQNITIPFHHWTPSDGRVFDDIFAFEVQMSGVDRERPWTTPVYEFGAACDGKQGYFIEKKHFKEFLQLHADLSWCFFNSPLQLAVLHRLAPKEDIYTLVEDNHIWDAQLLCRLYLLATEGSDGSDDCSLQDCVKRHLGTDFPTLESLKFKAIYAEVVEDKGVVKAAPTPNEYLGRTALVTILLFKQATADLRRVLDSSEEAFGHVSAEWLHEAIDKWGLQTHHIQLKAAIVLREITKAGLNIDVGRVADVVRRLETRLSELRRLLGEKGYMPGQQRAPRALQDILKRIEAAHPGQSFARTNDGRYETSRDALAPFALLDPFISAYREYQSINAWHKTLKGRLTKPIIHPEYNVLVTTGRTSSSGPLNAQNVPRDKDIRSCFVPPVDRVFITGDYRTIEMVTLAQSVMKQFDIDSLLAKCLNDGKDPHLIVAAKLTGKPENEVTDEERRKAKAINFGKSGGMGKVSLQAYAKVAYGVDMSTDEVDALDKLWLRLFPEMRAFLEQDDDVSKTIATFFNLTFDAHYEHTGDPRFIEDPRNVDKLDQPQKILGGMFLKAMAETQPRFGDGRNYGARDIAFFWAMAKRRADKLPLELRQMILRRSASKLLCRKLIQYVDHQGVFTLTGRLRQGVSYCSARNTVFQGLAADGAKLALWRLWRAGYTIHNFIHDEVIISVPATGAVDEDALEIRLIMIQAMREVVPDVAVGVESQLMSSWGTPIGPTEYSSSRKTKIKISKKKMLLIRRKVQEQNVDRRKP